MRPDLALRPFQPGDEEHIFALFRQCFGRELPEPYWRWRYLDNPMGQGVVCLAWHGDRLVAHHAVSCLGLRLQHRDWVMGLGGGAMTHPDYRTYGLYRQIAAWTWERMAELGMPVAVAFANAFSHRLLVRDLDFVDLYEVPTFRLPLAEASRLPHPSHKLVEVDAFDRRFDRLWNQVKDGHEVVTLRNRARLQWRYMDHPTARYRVLGYVDGGVVLGYAVLKPYGEDLHAVDVLSVPDPEVGVQLMAGAAHLGRESGATALSLWLNVTHPLHWALEKLGFRNGEPITYFAGRVLVPQFPKEVVYDFRRWYLTMGDSDVY